MVTFAQAQERAERWVNGDVPAERHSEVRVREFDLGFVAWAEPPGGPGSEVTRARLVIARDSGDTTLWPGLPVGEIIRRYEEEYGPTEVPAAPAGASAPQRLDLEATSFLLTPPEWLQQAADQMGIPDRRSTGAGAGRAGASASASAAAGSSPWDAADTSSSGGGEAQSPPATVFAPPLSGDPASADAKTELMPEGPVLPSTAVSPAVEGTDQPAPGQQGQASGQAPGQAHGPGLPPPPPMPPDAPAPPPGQGPGGDSSGGG
ncbi:hypothetical protein DB35_26350, partial [Streptomyces abyssalis]